MTLLSSSLTGFAMMCVTFALLWFASLRHPDSLFYRWALSLHGHSRNPSDGTPFYLAGWFLALLTAVAFGAVAGMLAYRL